MKNQVSAGKNQWLRSADGGKLFFGKTGDSGEGGEIVQDVTAGKVVPKLRDCRDMQRNTGEKEGEIIVTDIMGVDSSRSNEGVIVGNQKRMRVNEEGLFENPDMGRGNQKN